MNFNQTFWGNATQIPINCSDPLKTHVPINTPIASFATVSVCAVLLPIIIIIGVIGNSLTLVILKTASQTTTGHFHLWCLAIFDIISLISYLPTFWVVIIMKVYYYHMDGPINPANWVEYYFMGGSICSLRMFFTFTARTCSVWAIVVMTAERFILVLFPMKGTQYCTLKNAKIAIVVMVGAVVAINIPWFFAFRIIKKPCFLLGICIPNSVLFVNRMIEFTIMTIVPAILIFIFNICIIVTLKKRQSLSILVDREEAKRQERIITTRLLCVSFTFLILTFPSLVIVTIHTIHHFNDDKSHLSGAQADAFVISIVLFSVNLAVNFVIYCLTGDKFRKAAFNLIKCDFAKMRKYRNCIINEQSTTNQTEKMDLLNTPKNSVTNDINVRPNRNNSAV